MTDQSRAARTRRGGRSRGWLLLTSLLVLAIAASSTLVFTNRVELLRLAVILSLWAAVVAAFVTVVYRRQSEVDQARARDMKFVYDLQLDREIAARREYELAVESQLRRTLSREIRAEAADEMAALRSELVSLRTQLEVMLGTDLGQRPALESDRMAVPMPAAPGRVESSRVTVVAEQVLARETVVRETAIATESPIIDVPEAPLVEPVPVAAVVPPVPPPPRPPVEPFPPGYRGSHRRRTETPASPPAAEPVIVTPAPPQVPPRPPAAPRPEAPPWRPPEVRVGRHSSSDNGQPVARPEPVVAPEPPRGRHWVPADPQSATAGRHRGPDEQPAEPPVAEEPQGQHAGGQPLSDLMARLQVNRSSGGGGRRRRED